VDPFLAEIRPFPFNFAPLGWAMCNGQILAISQNTALFSLLGTQFGGNGTSNFALPNLQGLVPLNSGQGPGLSPYNIGDTGGETAVTVLQTQLPQHSHALNAAAASATTNSPSGALIAEGHGSIGRGGAFTIETYAGSGNAAQLAPSQMTPSGGSQPHNNIQPYLTLNFCIALQGIFPARS
jgi:microcystin-dependent protein